MNTNPLNHKVQRAFKRFIDIAIALAVLILTWPILAGIALAIKLDSKGPVFYRHRRIGKDGDPFHLYKFRTMVSGGDDSGYMRYLRELIESERDGSSRGLPYAKMAGDSRVTRLGQVLRCYYLDELPQLINIIKGEMSLVGPRPHVQFEVDNYTPDQWRRLSVKPGATGLCQVAGKADCTFTELIDLDLQYIESWNLWYDVKIIFMTGSIMLRGGEKFWARMTKQVPEKVEMG